MSKLITIWGCPNCGKTTFAVKLSSAIYDRYNCTVLMLSCDNTTPALPLLFPNLKSDELYSVGTALSKPDITQQEVINSIVTLKGKPNLGYLGYKDSENRFTYPDYDENKAMALLSVLKSLADYVIVDCTSNLDNVLSSVSIQKADEVMRLTLPTLKCLSFFSSQLPLYAEPKYKLNEHIIGLNITESDCYLPIEEAKSHFKEIAFTLPYCHEIRQQSMDGELAKTISDKKYSAKLKAITDKLVSV